MKIEEAKEILDRIDIKFFLSGMIEQNNYIVDKADEVNTAIYTVLNELDKKDKVIDMMAEQIRASDIDENICKLITEPTECVSRDCKCENCIKEYFYKKAEEK